MWFCSENFNTMFAYAGESATWIFFVFPDVDAQWGLWLEKVLSADPMGPVSVL